MYMRDVSVLWYMCMCEVHVVSVICCFFCRVFVGDITQYYGFVLFYHAFYAFYAFYECCMC